MIEFNHHAVADVRRRKGMTQAELAGRAGVTRQTVTEAESGARSLNVKTLVKLANALGISDSRVFFQVPILFRQFDHVANHPCKCQVNQRQKA